MAGWASEQAKPFRQAVLSLSIELHHYPGAPDTDSLTGQFWDHDRSGAGTVNHGDSGGPLYVLRPDRTRDVIGVAVGQRYPDVVDCNLKACDVWTDITRGAPNAWLHNQVIDHTRSPAWLAKHGHSEIWEGEVDYTGPCQASRDQDCDHWYDEHDYCPAFYNPFQFETDTCRKCPLVNKADADPDDDGVCDANDNCPITWNPDQANCNERSELARRAKGFGTAILGDMCDSVPCPRASADVVAQTGVGSNGGVACSSDSHLGQFCRGRLIRDSVRITPVPSYAMNQVVNGGPTSNFPSYDVPTDVRFCQSNLDRGFDCKKPIVISDEQLQPTKPAADETFDPSFPWHRITFASRTRDDGGEPLQYTDIFSATRRWDYRPDYQFWLNRPTGPIIPEPTNYSECTNNAGYGDGTCLDGTFWLHAETTVGSRSNGRVGNAIVGNHDDELANYYFELRPDEAKFMMTARPSAPLMKEVPMWRTPPSPDPDGWWDINSRGVRALPIVASELEPIKMMTFPSGRFGVDASLKASPRFTTMLKAHSAFWFNVAEPSLRMGIYGRFPDMVAMARNGTSIVDYGWSSNGRLAAGEELRCSTPGSGGDDGTGIGGGPGTDGSGGTGGAGGTGGTGSDGVPGNPCGNDPASPTAFAQHLSRQAVATSNRPSPRSDFAGVFSRAAGATFVVGGMDTAGKPLGDIWVHPVDVDEWSPVPLKNFSLGRVLAATYSFKNRRLWILDEVERRGLLLLKWKEARLLSVDPATGTVETVANWQRLGMFGQHWLTVDMDGSLLITASNPERKEYRTARVRFRDGHTSISLANVEHGMLATQPFVDEGGYGFVVLDNGFVTTVRHSKLEERGCLRDLLRALF
jgi:hypothetical protein